MALPQERSVISLRLRSLRSHLTVLKIKHKCTSCSKSHNSIPGISSRMVSGIQNCPGANKENMQCLSDKGKSPGTENSRQTHHVMRKVIGWNRHTNGRWSNSGTKTECHYCHRILCSRSYENMDDAQRRQGRNEKDLSQTLRDESYRVCEENSPDEIKSRSGTEKEKVNGLEYI